MSGTPLAEPLCLSTANNILTALWTVSQKCSDRFAWTFWERLLRRRLAV